MENTPLQERLAILSEECGEVVQAIGKILRHGLDSKWEDNPSNRELLEEELGDVQHAIAMLTQLGDIDPDKIDYYQRAKCSRIKRYLHHEENKV